ncbi:MAG: hypothetical protein ACRDF7_00060 [Candidatus Limnocylindrales bacterium]
MPGPLYLPPVEGEILQGDLFANVPSAIIDARPLRVARRLRADQSTWVVHEENGATPAGGFKWGISQGGEVLLARAFLGLGMVLSHDCEIENDPNIRTLAMVRPATDLAPDDRAALINGARVRYSIFPLAAQTIDPKMELSFVVRRLTTVRPAVLDPDARIASLSEELRAAVAARFRQYLFRRVEPSGVAD